MTVIRVRDLYKNYKVYFNRWSRLIDWVSPVKFNTHEIKCILNDLNFDIEAGESVGIIGANGAGKSTLLKIITGTSKASRGDISVVGRITALLELGIGFHPDYTGRQNLYTSGQLLGMTAKEISSFMTEIESFAEIGEYIDQPVRVYSSGMQVRLAFSLATAVRPDILIVDEALSVGDIFFQQKCFDRIAEMKRKGTTILFVTHDMGSIYRLCDKAIYINEGKIKAFGDVKKTISEYELDLKLVKRQLKEVNDATIKADTESNGNTYYDSEISNDIVRFKRSSILYNNEETDSIEEGKEFIINVEVDKVGEEVKDFHIGFQIRDAKGNIYFETNTYCQKINCKLIGNTYSAEFNLTNNLCQGSYILSFGAASEGYGLSSFNNIFFHDVGKRQFTVIRTTEHVWAGLCNMRVKT